jgi:hypothetical protein
MINAYRAALTAVMILAVSSATAKDAPKAPSAVIELFTSQGCSSCPPADVLLETLSHRPDVVVLSLPVDYWDYLGWKDTLASPMFSARQRAYAMERGDRQVYTPQSVVNGSAHALGSDLEAIEAAIHTTSQHKDVLSLPVRAIEHDGRIEVELDEHAGSPKGEIWLIAVATKQSVAIERGENAERQVVYSNVVRKMTRLGPWKGKPCKFAVAREDVVTRDADKMLVVVQAGNGGMPGAILGASWVSGN